MKLSLMIVILLLTSGCVEGNLNVNLGLSSGDSSGPESESEQEPDGEPEAQPCYRPLSPAAKAELDSMGYSKTKHPNLYQFLLSSGRLKNSIPPCPAE